MNRRLVVWRGLEEWLAETCEVTLDGDRLHARGTQLGAEPHPYRVDYELTTAEGWVTERLAVTAHDAAGQRELDLRRAADGSWTANGAPQPHVDGALVCDSGFTAELELDEDGLVVRYPRLAERVASASAARA